VETFLKCCCTKNIEDYGITNVCKFKYIGKIILIPHKNTHLVKDKPYWCNCLLGRKQLWCWKRRRKTGREGGRQRVRWEGRREEGRIYYNFNDYRPCLSFFIINFLL
jgi:hypothetical protein